MNAKKSEGENDTYEEAKEQVIAEVIYIYKMMKRMIITIEK